MEGKAGDYLMEGVQGELYVCDQSVFDESYEFIDPEGQPHLDIRRVGDHLAFEGRRFPLEDVVAWNLKGNAVRLSVKAGDDLPQSEFMVTHQYDLAHNAREALKKIDEAMGEGQTPPRQPMLHGHRRSELHSLEEQLELEHLRAYRQGPRTSSDMVEEARQVFSDMIRDRISTCDDPMKPLTIKVDVGGLDNAIKSELIEHLMHYYSFVVREDDNVYACNDDAFQFPQHTLRQAVR